MVSVAPSPVPSPQTGAAAGAAVPEATRRLADQLQALSQVAESLTFRLLELEERLAAQNEQLQPLIAAADGGDSVAVEGIDQRLADTEARLARMESALAGLPQRPVSGFDRLEQPVFAEEESPEHDPFPRDDGEQPFLDEDEETFLERRIA